MGPSADSEQAALIPILQNNLQVAIETTGREGSIAVFEGQQVLRHTNLDPQRRTAATLAPALDQIFKWCRQNGRQLDFVSIADGPGSFTGLRIGVTTAKTVSYALGCPLVPVDSLAAIAAAALHDQPHLNSICVATNAYRGQVFVGDFRRQELLPELDAIPPTWTAHPPTVRVLQHEQWEAIVKKLPDDTAIAGDAHPFGERADQRISRQCDAIGVGVLAVRAVLRNQIVDPLQLVPRYLKPSAAEEKAVGRGE